MVGYLLAISMPWLAAWSLAQGAATTATSPTPVTSQNASSASLVAGLFGQTDPRLRREAALKLLRSASAEGPGTIVGILIGKNNDAARLATCEAIAESSCQEAAYIAPLLAIMQSREPAMALRRAAAAALAGYLDPAPEIADKIKVFRQEEEAVLLAESHAVLMRALHECTPEAERDNLMEAWLKQPLALERYTALDIVQQRLRKGLPGPNVLRGTRDLLADTDDLVRQKAVFVVRTLGQREDAPRLRAMLKQPQTSSVREAIYSALGLLGDTASIPDVTGGLGDATASVVAEAATALAHLIQQQPSPPQAIVAPAVQALLKRGSAGMDDPVLRERIIDAMGTIADPQFLTILTAHASSGELTSAVRQAAIRGLGRIGDRSILPAILQSLAVDTDAGVREAAADAVGRLATDVEPLDALRRRLDPSEESSTSVQNKAWDAYLAILSRLPLDQQQGVLKTWPSSDATSASRRIDLLTAIERQATLLHVPDAQLATLREQLADALIASSRPADAGPVLARALETMKHAAPAERSRATGKMIDAYLRTSPDKAIAAAAALQGNAARDAAAEKLLAYVTAGSTRDPAGAALLLERLREIVPDQFGPRFAERFDRARMALPITSKPASAPASSF